MLRKKLRIQKSYRIDVELDKKICVLAWYLDRPQNDIINEALQRLFDDVDVKSQYEYALKQYEPVAKDGDGE